MVYDSMDKKHDWENEIFPLAKKYGLSINRKKDGYILLGNICVECKPGKDFPTIVIDYDVEVFIPYEFPSVLPTAKEISNRISKDFHQIGEELCMGTPQELSLKINKTRSIDVFFREFLISYLYSYSHYERFGKPPFGEYSHGHEGIFEFYRNHFDCDSTEKIIQALCVVFPLASMREPAYPFTSSISELIKYGNIDILKSDLEHFFQLATKENLSFSLLISPKDKDLISLIEKVASPNCRVFYI